MDDSMAWWIATETVFGIAYALGVHWYTVAHPEHPYVSLEVVFGVLVTMAITMLILPGMFNPGALILLAFICSGSWQIAGDIYRNTTKQTHRDGQVAQLMETITQLERKVSDLSQQVVDLQLEVGTND